MDNKLNIFTAAACSAVALANDMKHIHLHAVGELFDQIHEIAGEYYETASDDSDYLAELALENDSDVPNFSFAASTVEWSPETDTAYDFESCVDSITSKLGMYIGVLESLRNSSGVSTNIQSKIDDMTRWWKKERDYKTKRRSAVEVGLNGFINTGADEATINYISSLLSKS